ncbi:type 4a pilus biogenesis lipoprotein PilP [Pseudomonas sp. NPDC077186]|jgi:type IV pilus assembly protein PilP|uniref:type 4a pilus biogenesis lipoprotein PilP n=1 Tax=Pseudomonas sp. NPDC077186 TaxID=3364421 RepID=UPI0037C805C0
MKASKLALLPLFLTLLQGCSSDGDFSDLQAFMTEVRARPKGAIEPLPKFQPYEAFAYSASSLRSPFQPPVKVEAVSRPKGSQEIKPDESRVREFLEGFNIEIFEMVGTLSNSGGVFALVSGAGGVHRVKVGDYLGRNHGRIVAVDDAKIEVVEIVPDGDGGWLERPRSLALKERS